MRFRVKHRASLFADSVKPEYYDGWTVFCEHCKAPGSFMNFERADASRIAREANAIARGTDHVFVVVPVVGSCPVMDEANSRVIWLPQPNGMAQKHLLLNDEFERMFARVEE